MEFIKKHLVESTLLFIFIVLFILGGITVLLMWNQGSGMRYGNRLNEIENVKIKDADLKTAVSKMKEEDYIHSVNAKVEGRIINLFVKVDNGTDKNTAKGISTSVLASFDNKEQEYYDIQIYITEANPSEESAYPIIGYKSKLGKDFIWTNN